MKLRSKIKLSQTTIKEFLKEDYCPLKTKEIYLERNVDSEPTLSMQKGIYFETQCIGSGVLGKKLDDLPRLKNGNKNADHQRIDMQVMEFKNVLNHHTITIKDTQVNMKHKVNSRLFLDGTADIIGSIYDEEFGMIDEAIIDLKLTANIFSQFGDYCWHFPANMDHTQAQMYSFLYEKINGIEVPFYYLVFDYKPEPGYKIIRKDIKPIDKHELKESVRSTVEKIDYHDETGWRTKPNYENCKTCPLKDKCPDYSKAKKIEVI